MKVLPAMTISLARVPRSEIAPADRYADHTIFQTEPWIKFLEETQAAEPVFAHVLSGRRVIGRFVGLLITKLGIRILGSPMRGWTTSYMGLCLEEDVDRLAALRALTEFAVDELRCMHLELFDRHLSFAAMDDGGYRFFSQTGFEIDLGKSDEQLLAGMTQGCRRNIRKAQRAGVQVEVAKDGAFVSDYCKQLKDVFARQGLVPPYNEDRVASLMRNILPTGNLLLLRALDPYGKCIATGIYPAGNTTMYFWGGASWREHHHLRPNQMLHWAAMMYWKARGMKSYDMGGGGAYKKQYGGREIAVPWVMASKYPALHLLRNCARTAWRIRQRTSGLARAIGDKLHL